MGWMKHVSIDLMNEELERQAARTEVSPPDSTHEPEESAEEPEPPCPEPNDPD